MILALFDLDHTLLPVDSADGWSHFLVRAGALDHEVTRQIGAFAASYRDGSFDVEAYLAFQMGLLARFPRLQLERWRAQYVREHVLPAIRPAALALVAGHRDAGHELALVTGTHSFVSRPIATAFGLPHLLAAQPEEADGRFTGRYVGTHTYQSGKVRAVEGFLAARGLRLDDLEDSIFYSDSINDLPLLERVRTPVVTNGDARLRAIAAARGWRTLDLFAPPHGGARPPQPELTP